MREPMSPCLFCDEKQVGCHVECERYNAFKEEHHKWKMKVGEEKQKEYIMQGIRCGRK